MDGGDLHPLASSAGRAPGGNSAMVGLGGELIFRTTNLSNIRNYGALHKCLRQTKGGVRIEIVKKF